MLRSLVKDWNYFWNEHCNLLFLAIYCSQFSLFIFLASSWHQKTKIGLLASFQNKKILWTKRPMEEKMINCHFQGLHKITCQIKQIPTFLSFSFLIDCCMTVFLFSYKSVCKSWKTDKISSASFGKLSLYIKMEKIWKYWKCFAKSFSF